MRYRFGSFGYAPETGSSLAALQQLLAYRRATSASAARHIEPLIVRERQRLAMLRAAPDILTALPSWSDDLGWLHDLARAAESIQAGGRELRLVRCEAIAGTEGSVIVVMRDAAMLRSVRHGDLVSPGFVAQRSLTLELEIAPRLYRQVCTNGQVVEIESAGDLLARAGGIAAAVERCLSPGELERTVADLQVAAQQRADAALPALVAARVAPAQRAAIADRFARDRDPTWWGLMNAVTAHARTQQPFARRLELERAAGRLVRLARVERLRAAVAPPFAVASAATAAEAGSGCS